MLSHNQDQNIGVLARSQSVDTVYDAYRKNLTQEEGSIVGPLRTLENLVTEGDDITEGSFMNATPQAIEFAAKGYQESKKGLRKF